MIAPLNVIFFNKGIRLPGFDDRTYFNMQNRPRLR